jgi:hypothetical protein
LTTRTGACLHARMAAITHPARSRVAATAATAASGKEPLQVRIPTPIKRAFKSRAALRGLEPNELFVEVWEHYERTHPGEKPRSTKR